eukprot:TRINITY_DN2913_c0_g1_i3.p1 TRINITY_DN2913_c0_g1~~TRINITY_DN2913_c0_g1_i3.p1  ORF type:complete len:193 (-),score=19.75 TRINITY_DN2913_c0_g1_i3:237-815(-)
MIDNHGAGLLEFYGSISELKKELIPLLTMSTSTSCHQSKDKSAVKKVDVLLTNIEEQLKIKRFSDLYSVSIRNFKEHEYHTIPVEYGSLHSFFQKYYPEYNFAPWGFPKLSTSFWDSDTVNKKNYIEWAIQRQTNIKTIYDLDQITVNLMYRAIAKNYKEKQNNTPMINLFSVSSIVPSSVYITTMMTTMIT